MVTIPVPLQIVIKTHPEDDTAWQRVVVNASPDTVEGSQYRQEIALPTDDIRLARDSKLESAGLLDLPR